MAVVMQFSVAWPASSYFIHEPNLFTFVYFRHFFFVPLECHSNNCIHCAAHYFMNLAGATTKHIITGHWKLRWLDLIRAHYRVAGTESGFVLRSIWWRVSGQRGHPRTLGWWNKEDLSLKPDLRALRLHTMLSNVPERALGRNWCFILSFTWRKRPASYLNTCDRFTTPFRFSFYDLLLIVGSKSY